MPTNNLFWIISFLKVLIFFPLTVFAQNVVTENKYDTTYVNSLLKESNLSLRINSEKSLQLAQDALAVAKKINYTIGIGKSYFSIGNCHNILASFNDAKNYYNLALDYAKQGNDKLLIQQCYTSLGIILSKLDDYELALKNYQQSILFSEEMHDDLQASKSYNGIAMLMIKIKEYDKWETYSNKSLNKAYKSNNAFCVMLALHDKGAAYHRMGRERNIPIYYDSAILYYRKARFFLDVKIAENEKRAMLYISQNDMGSLFFEQKKIDSAELYLKQALVGAKQQNSTSIICSIYNDLGQIFTEKKDFEKATTYLNDALQLAQNISFERKRSVYNSLSTLAIAKGDFKAAYDYQTQMLINKDSIYNIDKATAVNNLNIKYDTKQNQLKIDQLKSKNSLQNKLQYFSFGLILFFLLALIFLTRSMGLQKKINKQNIKLLNEEKENALLLKNQFEIEREKTYLSKKLKEEENSRLESELRVKKLLEETMQIEIAAMQRELSVDVMQTEKKNELITTLRTYLTELEKNNKLAPLQLKDIYKLLDKTLEIDNDFDKFSLHFLKVHPLFFQHLQEKSNNNLSPLDLKYCAYMKMNLSGKEIANLLNVSADSIRVTRHRLKQKLGLKKDDDLFLFLQGE